MSEGRASFWWEVCVLTREAAWEAVSEALRSAGADGVRAEAVPEGGDALRVCAYVLPHGREGEGGGAFSAFLADVRAGLERIARVFAELGLDAGPLDVSSREVREEDWAEAWKAFFVPLFLGETFVVVPPWREVPPEAEGRRVLRIDPGMAFGTGHHPSTALAVELLEAARVSGARVLDVGTGSGILALAACALGAREVLAVDVDPLAVRVAWENVAAAGVSDCVRVVEGDLLHPAREAVKAGAPPFDLLLANLLLEPILRLLPEAPEVLSPEGSLVLSGVLRSERDPLEAALAASGFAVRAVREREGWVGILAARASALRPLP
ncbi:50S ribosomal protein L11 methyltransferase [Brockia lithotrophica]|uniref:Ribosomal protein L11 methyltransferase n=1 Tax=Brockia lithotrophica TaxID=933949 RepID=A0A660L3X4_9BACL|nr:50S ribosomal protein L11 methyltransferase [Brockia lithotrophica]RKQ88606.1 [LSU ribosomal protein L11P]-lysine N-methyltransferase [Brockia lithotrophica]